VLKAKYKCVTSPFVSKQGISRFRYGLAVVQDESKKETRYGVINLKGKEVLKLGKFSSPTVLTDNLIGVHSNKSYYDAQIIDLKGKKKWSGVAGDFYRQGDLIIFNGSSKEYKYGALNLDLKEAVPFDYDDLKVGYESKVVALQRGEAWSVYSTDDLSKPLIDRPITAVTVSTDSPFVGFYNKNSVQGWFLYDCRNHQIH